MKAKPNEIALYRVYDAPARLVWDAWTDPKQAAQWWGPRGFTITTKSKELKVGGQWIYTMHGPDGTDWPNIATYHEVVDQKRLVYDHGATETTPPLFRVTVTFEEKAGKTHMHMIMALETPEAAEATKGFIKTAGGNSTWDRLAEYLDKKES
ncbi:MAG: ATPase [Proteobacteria bacterium]|nr:MAG: ATPase [Pseudomonadota bacterium]